MSRPIESRLKITGRLKTHGPLSVGGMGGNEDVDLMIALDGQNRPYIPGTSLTGPMRAWLAQRQDEGTVNDLFGPPQEKGSKNEGRASFVLVEDGLILLPEDGMIETRDGVGIDRMTGAAAEGAKYDRAVIPNGAEIELAMAVEIAGEFGIDLIKGIFGALLQALKEGEIRFGASKSRGLGLVKLETVTVKEQNLLATSGILQALRNQEPEIELPIAELKPRPQLEIAIKWAQRGPLMVKAGRDGVGVDMLPLTSAIDGKLSFVLPGSSIKGPMRAQAERIVRTLVPEIASKESFLDQVAVPLITDLFGAAAKSDEDDKNLEFEGPPLPGLSALTVEDCYAKPRFTREQWGKIEQASAEIEKAGETESELYELLGEAGLGKTQMAMHVAVDRWTGGAADGFLYSALEPHGVEWNDINLRLDLGRIGKEKQLAAVACLLFTLRDLSAGRIPLGFAANRGMGSVAVRSVGITARGTDDADILELADINVANGKFEGLSEGLKSKLNQAWKDACDWIKEESLQEGQKQ